MSYFILFVTLFSITTIGNGLHRIPLKRINTSEEQHIQTRDGHPVFLRNKHNVAYVGQIKIGDNPRNFDVLVDTGSSNLIIPSKFCDTCGSHLKFQCRNSSNYYSPLMYGTGSGHGHLCTDNITISSGLSVQNQEFTVIDQEDGDFRYSPFDGILGMGFKETTRLCKCLTPLCIFHRVTCRYEPYIYHPSTVFQNLVTQGTIQQNMFSLYLSGPEDQKSELTLGGSDPNHYSGNLTYAYIPDGVFRWVVPMDGFEFESYELNFCNLYRCMAVVDSGTSTLTVPQDQKWIIEEFLGAMVNFIPVRTTVFQGKAATTYAVPATEDISRLRPIIITIANQTFEIKPSDYMNLQDNFYYLKIEILPVDFWILGDVFLRKVYTQFDMGKRRIGFAPAK